MSEEYVSVREALKVEQALQESSRRFSDMLKNVRMIAILLNREGLVTFCNDFFLELTGYNREQVLGQNWFDVFIPPDQSEALKESFFQKIHKGPISPHDENSILTMDGERRSVLWNNIILRDFNGHVCGTASLGTDITDHLRIEEALRKVHKELGVRVRERTRELSQANELLRKEIRERELRESELQQSEERYRLLFEMNPYPAIVYDPATLRFLSANPAAVERYGYSAEEFLFMKLTDLHFEEDISAVLNAVRQVRNNSVMVVKKDWMHRGKDGSIILVEAMSHSLIFEGRPARLVLMNDVTEQRRAEKALKESEKRYRDLFDSVLDGVFQTTPEGKYLMVNPALVRMLGYESKEELMAVDTRTHYPDLKTRLSLTKKLEEEGELRNVELVLKRKDGSRIVTLANARVIRDESGRAVRYEGTLADVTERKLLEQRKNELISIVSHELKTPLTSILGSLEYIGSKGTELSENIRNLIHVSQRGSQRMLRLINDLLDLDKIESGKMSFDCQVVKLMPLIEQSVEMCRPFAGQQGVRLAVPLSLPDVKVIADSDRLIQVIANLLSNAIKFSPRNGVVEVSVLHNQHAVRVAVQDRGPGIPEKFRATVFEKFAQGDYSPEVQKKGTGLGLSISKAIIETMSGSIGFETVVGKGTTFYFELPESL